MADLSFSGRLLFIGLWCIADREGRFEWSERRIKVEVFPYDEIDINRELTVLQRLGLVVKYVVDGKSYGEVVNFKKHQTPHHTEKQSLLPTRPEKSEGCDLTVDSPLMDGGNPPDCLITDSLITDCLNPESRPLTRVSDKPDQDSGSTPAFSKNQKSTKNRGSRFGLDTLPVPWAEFCLENRKDLDPQKTFERFSDYWKAKAGKDACKLDWFATWRNWIRNEKGFDGTHFKNSVGGVSKTRQREIANRQTISEWLSESSLRASDSQSTVNANNTLPELGRNTGQDDNVPRVPEGSDGGPTEIRDKNFLLSP